MAKRFITNEVQEGLRNAHPSFFSFEHDSVVDRVVSLWVNARVFVMRQLKTGAVMMHERNDEYLEQAKYLRLPDG